MARTDFGSHAYWRVQCYWMTFTAFTAMLFKDETGSSIAATGGSAIESGHFSTDDSSMLFDGTDSTFWISEGHINPWAGYHFGSAKKVMQIALQVRSHANMGNTDPPLYVGFDYSDDGVVWAQAGSAHLGSMTVDVPKWFDLAQCVNP